MKKLLSLGLLVALLAAGFCPAMLAAESGFSTGTTAAAVTFGPVNAARRVVKAVEAQSDVALAAVSYYWKPTGVAKYGVNTIAAFAAANATNLYIAANTSLTNGDYLVYAHADGTCDFLQMIAAGATPSMTNIYVTSGITVAATNGDYLYEVQEKYGVEYGYTAGGTPLQSNATYSAAGDKLVSAPADSPIVIRTTGTARCRVAGTVE